LTLFKVRLITEKRGRDAVHPDEFLFCLPSGRQEVDCLKYKNKTSFNLVDSLVKNTRSYP